MIRKRLYGEQTPLPMHRKLTPALNHSEQGPNVDDIQNTAFCAAYIARVSQGLLCLFAFSFLVRRFAVQKYPHKCHPSSDCYPDACNPNPTSTDLPASRILVVRKMANSNFTLDFHIRKERPFVVDFEREDPVLIGSCEGSAKDGAVGGMRDGL